MRHELEQGSEWILTENLEKSQARVLGQGLEEIDPNNDFGSYRLLNSGRGDSRIEAHNATGNSARCYAKSLRFQVRKLGIGHGTIADLGCGAGFIAAAVRQEFPESAVSGYDIAAEAIGYARKSFPEVTFHAAAIEPGMRLPERFDLIYANEFYPFTRTDSLSFYLAYLDTLLAHVGGANGALVVSMISQEKCLLLRLDEIRARYRDAYTIVKSLVPSAKILSLFRNFALAQLATRMANIAFGRKNHFKVIFMKKECLERSNR